MLAILRSGRLYSRRRLISADAAVGRATDFPGLLEVHDAIIRPLSPLRPLAVHYRPPNGERNQLSDLQEAIVHCRGLGCCAERRKRSCPGRSTSLGDRKKPAAV